MSWADPLLTRRLESLLTLFQTRILNPQGTHLQHFFDEAWQPRSASYTFGHDIEGSWLLCEAAEALGGPERVAAVRDTALQIARAVLREGVDADGGLCYEARDGQIVDDHKEWWPQAEAVVGFYNAWQLSRRRDLPPGGRALLALYPDTDRRPGKRGMVLARLTRRHTRRHAAQSLRLEMPVPQRPLLSGDHPQNIGRNQNRKKTK